MRWLCLISLFLFARGAAAAPAVLVIPVGKSSADLQSVTKQLARGLTAQYDVSVVAGSRGEAAHITAEVSKLLVKAKQASRRFAEKEALELLEQAERLVQDRCAVLISVQSLIDVLLARAKLQAELGRKRGARETLRRAVALAPSSLLDPGTFPPAMQRMHRELKRALKSAPSGLLAVTSAPAGLKVFVDGVERGRSPLQLRVPAGPHLVAAGEPGASQASLIELDAGGRRELVLPVPRMASEEQAWKEVGRLRGVQWVVAVRLRGEGSSRRVLLRLVPVAAGFSSRLLEGQAGQELGASAEALAERVPAAMGDEGPSGGGGSSTSIFKRWWFWTAVGVVAVGAGTTTAILLSRDEPGVRLRLVP